MRKWFGAVQSLVKIDDMHEARVLVRSRESTTEILFVVRTDTWGGRRWGVVLGKDHPHLKAADITTPAKNAAKAATLRAIDLGRIPGPCPFDRTVVDAYTRRRRAPNTVKEFEAVVAALTYAQCQDALDREEVPGKVHVMLTKRMSEIGPETKPARKGGRRA